MVLSSVSSLSHSNFVLDVQSSTDKKIDTTQDRQTVQNSDERQYRHLILRSKQCYRVVTEFMSLLDVCIFARLKVNCEVMPLRIFANFWLTMSGHRKDLRGAPKARGSRPWLAYE